MRRKRLKQLLHSDATVAVPTRHTERSNPGARRRVVKANQYRGWIA